MDFNYLVRYATNQDTIIQMIEFCKKYEHLWVYGCGEEQQYMAKYLRLSELPFCGYIVSERCVAEKHNKINGFPVICVEDYKNNSLTGIIIDVKEKYYNDIIPLLIKHNIKDFYLVESMNRYAIAQKLRPADTSFFWFEVNIVEHCNLNCQMCDHFSPIASEGYISLENFEKEIRRMSELMKGQCRILKLEGGEPTMHPQINDIIRIARHYFNRAAIYLYTNGILMKDWENNPAGNLWQTCAYYGVHLAVTEYPLKVDYSYLKVKAQEYGVIYVDVTSRDKDGKKYSFHHPFDLEGKIEPWEFINCFCFNNCVALRDGKIYPCSMLPNSHHFCEYYGKKLEVTKKDYIDIYEVKSFEEIAEFTSSRVPFCRYCNVKERKGFDWKVSKKDIHEWTKIE